MKNKVIVPIFIVLFLLAVIPFGFTTLTNSMLFGWLPASLAFWWMLMILNLVFVLAVCRHFVKVSEKNKGEEE